jgi:uncharacterized protein DUF1194
VLIREVSVLPSTARSAAFISILVMIIPGCFLAAVSAASAQREMVDTALVLAVDVSGSITPDKFALQMEGMARAFEDASVERAVLSGPHRSIFVTLVEWSNVPSVSVPWTLISNRESARAFAARIRDARRVGDQFTCMSAALQMIAGKVLPFVPAPAARTIIDVSGDGHDNCNPVKPVDAVRDELVAAGVTINGLPILEGDEADTLEQWYRNHVIGGQNAFLLPASGFRDFGRAIRAKFVLEISFFTSSGFRREIRTARKSL